jgi:hypothetical protein
MGCAVGIILYAFLDCPCIVEHGHYTAKMVMAIEVIL